MQFALALIMGKYSKAELKCQGPVIFLQIM